MSKLLTLTDKKSFVLMCSDLINIHPYWVKERGFTKEKFEELEDFQPRKLDDLRHSRIKNYAFCARCISLNEKNKEKPHYISREIKFERFFKNTEVCSLCQYEISGRITDE